MIKITEALKERLQEVRIHLQMLADPLLAERSFDGVFAIFDEYQQVIPGALRYSVSVGTGNGESDVSILGGIHMNEMSGVYALLKFHQRWLNGMRPNCGNVYVATGKIERALEFIDTVINAKSVSPELWGSFNVTKDHCNYNRIPFDILTKKVSNDFERHAVQIVKHVVQPAKGRVLDLHNTSVHAAPMVTMFMQDGETPEESIIRIKATGAINDFLIRDYIVWKPGPYNGVESIRSIANAQTGCVPILVENGGGANPDSFDVADIHTQLWLKNVTEMEPVGDEAETESSGVACSYYIETNALYHPDVKPDDYSYLDEETRKEAQKDTFVLIRDRRSVNAIRGWSKKARHALNMLGENNYSKKRLDNFMPIKKGDLIALGLNSGLELLSPRDGVMMMVGASPLVQAENRETFANIGVMLKGV